MPIEDTILKRLRADDIQIKTAFAPFLFLFVYITRAAEIIVSLTPVCALYVHRSYFTAQ